jgi:lipid A 3-O-deacylase
MKKKVIVFFILLLTATTVFSQQIAFQLYNDYFAGTDKLFTNGMALSWLDNTYAGTQSKDAGYSKGADKLLHVLHLGTPQKPRTTAGMSVAQFMLTPHSTTPKEPQYNDMPYAGYLAFSFFAFEWNDNSYNEYRATVGVIGKQAGCKFVQVNFHHLIKDTIPQGWDTQIATRYVANLLIARGYKSWKHHFSGGYEMDWANHFGGKIGNNDIEAFGSTVFRVGKNYVDNFNAHYPYLKEEASLLDATEGHKGFGYALSVGITGQALAYSYIISEAKKEGYHITENHWNTILYSGLELFYGNSKFTFLYQMQSPYIKQESDKDIVGSFLYAYRF